MVQMNPYYAHSSPVGDVFDVATWTPRKEFIVGLVGLISGLVFLAGAVYLYQPSLLHLPPKIFKELDELVLAGHKKFGWAMIFGGGLVGLLGYSLFAAGIASFIDTFKGNFYLRAGRGGLSLRLPGGVDWTKLGLVSTILKIDVPWAEVERIKIVQVKQLGSLSANTGNISADMHLHLKDGQKHLISMGCFREPSRIIHNRINDAQEMQTAAIDSTEQETMTAATTSQSDCLTVHSPSDKRRAVGESLRMLLQNDLETVILSDQQSGRFVQLINSGGHLLFDVPAQSLEPQQQQRAEPFFASAGGTLEDCPLSDYPGGPVVALQQSYQAAFTDADTATDRVLEFFREVHELPEDFALRIEHDA